MTNNKGTTPTLPQRPKEHYALIMPVTRRSAKLVHKLIHSADELHKPPCRSGTLPFGLQLDEDLALKVLYGTTGTTGCSLPQPVSLTAPLVQ